MAKIYSVSQVNAYIRNMFTQDFVLNCISIRGEVSNCKYHSSGHVYFSLKDASGTIQCIMFASARKGLAFRMSDGQQIVVEGSVSVYERDGKYQLYANRIQQDGAGILYERFLALKQELEDMGMFAPEYKKPIPAMVQKLGVVTAPTGAAVQDIINISTRRNPGIQLILYPAKVQGEGAAESVAAGIAALDALKPDVIIVGRGGGSIEDLWAFNEEVVARAVFACNTPVISAVGHETDTTISDYVADLRAPTPSAAAELAVKDMQMIMQQIEYYRLQLNRTMLNRISVHRSKTDQLRMKLKYMSPLQRIREQRLKAAELEEALSVKMDQKLQDSRHQMAVDIERMKGLSPLEKLNSGYAQVTSKQRGRVISVEQAEPGEVLYIFVRDGRIDALVQETKKLSYGSLQET